MKLSNNIRPYGLSDLSNFLKISKNLLSIMNIMNYKVTEEEIQKQIYISLDLYNYKNSFDKSQLFSESCLDLAQINSPETLLLKINDYMNEKYYDKREFLIIFHDYDRVKNKMKNILNKIKSLFSDENKKEEFDKSITLLNDKINNFQNINDRTVYFQPQLFQIFESNLVNSNIPKLIHKIQSLYFNEIDSEIFKDYYYELIYLLLQMELIRKEIDKSKLIRFINPFGSGNEFKEKKKGNKIKINYYNLMEKNIFLNLNLPVNEIIANIFESLFNNNIRVVKKK